MAWSVKKRLVVSFSVSLLLVIVGVVMVPVVDYVVKKKVESTVVIQPGGELYDIWREPPIPIYMQIYMFNLTNPAEFLRGDKPSLAQRGPYTYRERRIKFNITWNSNGTVSYRQKRLFHFIREKSVGNDTDVFITPNPVYWAMVNGVKYESPLLRKLIYDAAHFIHEGALMNGTLRGLIWGYRDPLLNITKGIDEKWFYTDVIGYFMNKNDTDDGVYTIYTGEMDITQLGVIQQYNGSNHLNFWTTPWANMINGTDGTLGPPYTPQEKELGAFASDVCRSIAGVFDEEVTSSQGINLWRYKAPDSYLASAAENPDNIGFCTPQSHCLGSGLVNLSVCQTVDFFHLPVAMSFPHFYKADRKYVDSVLGLNPNKEEHQVIIDIEPYTGLVLRAAKRLMISLYMEPIPDMKDTEHITPVFMPIFWINESAIVDDVNADRLKRLLFTPLEIIHATEVTVVSLGALIILVALGYGIAQLYKTRLVEVITYRRCGAVSDTTDSDDERNPLTPPHPVPSYTQEQT